MGGEKSAEAEGRMERQMELKLWITGIYVKEWSVGDQWGRQNRDLVRIEECDHSGERKELTLFEWWKQYWKHAL